MGVNKKKFKKKLSKFGKKVRHTPNKKDSVQEEDEEIILDNIEINNGIEITGEDELVPEPENLVFVCAKCEGELSNAPGKSSNNRYQCDDCGTLYELVSKGQKAKKKKSKKKKLKKAGHRAWRACVTGWKYLKAGMVFYVHAPANSLNITGMATAQMQPQNTRDPMYRKYGYMYKT